MPKFKTLNEAFTECQKDGCFIPTADSDETIIQSNIEIAEESLESSDNDAKDNRWNSAYKSLYDSLHLLAESFLIFDKVKSANHQCLFAYICTKHPEFEFSWDFFEKIRTKRNGINYYGKPVKKEDYKEVELQAKVYIRTLKNVITKKVK